MEAKVGKILKYFVEQMEAYLFSHIKYIAI